MASEERIAHAAEAEVAASASPTSTAGVGAGDPNGGTKAATSGESKNAAAAKASSTASASGKTKSGNGSSGGNNNQHRRKGNYKPHHQNQHQHQHQHQRQHHKGGQYNNHHRQQYQQRHQNRPGAYVPVNPRPISPPLSVQNPPPPLDLAARRSGLLQALTPQLEYYFSAANLPGDTYLRTLMDLNSGYVPVAAVATFGNVQRIVMRWDGGIPPTASTSPNPEDPLGGPLVRSEEEGVAGFVAAAARTSQVLDVVEIDADGKIVRTVCSADGKAQDEDKGEGGNKKNEEEDGSQGNEAKDKKSGSTAADIRIAIGPAGGGEASKSIAATGGSGGAKINAATPAPTATMQAAPEQTTIILRDAPEATTEKDIRSVFTAAKTNVTNVHPDVGNTWFVSLDAKTTSRDDVVSLLLSLRGMKLHGEPIKARLKTESVASRRGTASGGYGYAASAPQSPVTGRPGQFQQHGAGPMASTGGNRAAQPGRGGGGGGGMRPHHTGQSRSVPSSPMAGGRNANYGGGKPGGRGGKNIVALSSGPGNRVPVRRGSRNGDFFKATGSSSNMSSPKGADTTSKASSSATPPPTLADLHFPALDGNDGGGVKTPASQLQHRPKGAAPKDSDDKKLDIVEKPNKDEGKASAPKQPPAGGYAAALRKAAPAEAVGAEERKIAATSAAVGPDGKALKLPPSTGGQGPSSRESKSTTLTDDSSADDKSSVSSKPESIESHPAVTPVAPSWGGGNTFADILKKKQQATAAATVASTTAEEKNDDKPSEE